MNSLQPVGQLGCGRRIATCGLHGLMYFVDRVCTKENERKKIMDGEERRTENRNDRERKKERK